MAFRTLQFACAVALSVGLLPLLPGAAVAEPMKCSGEQQACLSGCSKLADRTLVRPCINSCSQRLAVCRQTGCWNNGTNNYCGLLRQ